MEKIPELIMEAQSGWISPEDLDYVVKRIEESRYKQEPDLYKLLHILAKGGTPEYRKLAERFLYYFEEPRVSAFALFALVDQWDLFREYVEEIKIFLKGVVWDVCQEVRRVAITAAGKYLRDHDDKEMLRELIQIHQDKRLDAVTRYCAYDALYNAMKGSSPELDYYSVLDKAKQRLNLQ